MKILLNPPKQLSGAAIFDQISVYISSFDVTTDPKYLNCGSIRSMFMFPQRTKLSSSGFLITTCNIFIFLSFTPSPSLFTFSTNFWAFQVISWNDSPIKSTSSALVRHLIATETFVSFASYPLIIESSAIFKTVKGSKQPCFRPNFTSNFLASLLPL